MEGVVEAKRKPVPFLSMRIVLEVCNLVASLREVVVVLERSGPARNCLCCTDEEENCIGSVSAFSYIEVIPTCLEDRTPIRRRPAPIAWPDH
jgi:hypothetical protein